MRPECTTEEIFMKIATLGIVLKDGFVLLGEKKRGEIGTGILSGPGGKLDPDETLEACLLRETREELNVELNPASLQLTALIDFYAAGEIDFQVYVYRASVLSGEIRETVDMIPKWYPLDDLPYDQMFDGDRHWFQKAVRGEKFCARVYYRNRARDFERIEFFPFSG